MRFKMLGPLEVTSGGRSIVLGGVKQRAALGFLLLQPNQVVSTSQLLRALWSMEEAPTTARKILQNAIWGLRRALVPDSDLAAPATLRTQSPGYALQVDRERVDHHQFNQWVSEGRSRLAAGAPEEASLLLRDALALWRGPALSDLVEAGVLWPELTTLQDSRLGVQEDFFEAQLASGQHYAVLSDLEVMVGTEPLRERSCGQLMRALYRCGRQADALGVYSRLRSALVEDLGLEPSRELQLLQQAILTHDPSLQLPASATAALTRSTPAPAVAPVPPLVQAPFAERPEPAAIPRARTPAAPPEPGVWGRRRAGILLVRAELSPELEADSAYDVAAAFDGTTTLIRQATERFGGVFAGAMGGVSLCLFPAGSHRDDHAERAVSAALAIRDALAAAPGPGIQEAVALQGIDARAAVTTGEALIRIGRDETVPASVNGALLQECQALLSLVAQGEVQVCERTRTATDGLFDYLRVRGSQDSWQARRAVAPPITRPHAGHGAELELLAGLLEHCRRWRRPHRVVVRGASEAARTRVFTDLRERVGGSGPESAQVVCIGGSRAIGDGPHALHQRILAAYCGVSESDSSQVAGRKLDETVRRLAQDQDHANWLVPRLGPVLDPTTTPMRGFDTGEPLDACHQFIEAATRQRPLVLIHDTVHLVPRVMQEFLQAAERSGRSMPLLAVTGTRPEASDPHQSWTGDGHIFTTITLDVRQSPAPTPRSAVSRNLGAHPLWDTRELSERTRTAANTRAPEEVTAGTQVLSDRV
jgi:DNA-binding SARP family transcriptional activator/class 3 adenylate cyclase